MHAGSKPVFCRTKLGEKVKEVERGRRALLFYGVPVIQRSPCGCLFYSGRHSPSIWQRWGVEGSSWLPGAETKRRTGKVCSSFCWPKMPTLLVGFVFSPPAQPSLAQPSLTPQPGCGVLCGFRRMEESVGPQRTFTFSQVPPGTPLLLSPSSFIVCKISLTASPALWLFQSGRSILPPAEHRLQQPA